MSALTKHLFIMAANTWNRLGWMVSGILIICHPIWSTGQSAAYLPGHYLSPAGESIRGYFNFENLSFNSVRFSPNQSAYGTVLLDPKTASRIEANDGTLVLSETLSFQGDTESIFIVRVLEGDINLYLGASKAQGELFFLNTSDVPAIVKINKRSPRTFLEGYFPGCDYRSTIPYNEASLIKALKKFHACRYPTSRDFAPALPGNRQKKAIAIGLKGGWQFGESRINGWFQEASIPMQGPGVGALLRVQFSNHVSLFSGVSVVYENYRWHGHFTAHRNDADYFYQADLQFGYHFAEIPIGVDYRFRTAHRWMPHVFAGFALLTSVRNPEVQGSYGKPYDLERIYPWATLEDGPELLTPEFVPWAKFGTSFFAGFGYDFWQNDRSCLGLSLKGSLDSQSIYGPGAEQDVFDIITISAYRLELAATYQFTLFRVK